MLTVSRSPSSEVAWRLPTETEGMMISGGRLWALEKWRASHPLAVVLIARSAAFDVLHGVEVAAARLVEPGGVDDRDLAALIQLVERLGRAVETELPVEGKRRVGAGRAEPRCSAGRSRSGLGRRPRWEPPG